MSEAGGGVSEAGGRVSEAGGRVSEAGGRVSETHGDGDADEEESKLGDHGGYLTSTPVITLYIPEDRSKVLIKALRYSTAVAIHTTLSLLLLCDKIGIIIAREHEYFNCYNWFRFILYLPYY
ncbi:hypothetical protein Pmani_020803 [Petrolisthes manimaculis]|uniref:Uncharacterized protein n=1 Tax=Petrolisthes manimaculis TaxID=1843537 RepID=A0AAE1U653_9EUCA|nr:hypothetical protein Pmani_020803 [Petrolisthes manimaculis]